jgi:pyruvate dehydrogenase E1 component
MLLYYRETGDGQILQEGVTTSGAFASWIAAATSHGTHGVPMIPVHLFYSMFGFQRAGDLIWAAADMRARGFLCGATAGRTTLNGEGFQHQDGHSHLAAAAMPSCLAYDPAYAYELAVIVRDGLRRMYELGDDVFYYLTLYSETYEMPPMPEAVEEGILSGCYLLRTVAPERSLRVQLMGSGPILREALRAAAMLEETFGIGADVWSITSFSELRRDGLRTERWNRLHPTSPPREPYVGRQLRGRPGPVVAASDHVKAVADQIRPFVPARFVALGTDGYGRSDTREALRRYFEVDSFQIALAAVKALADVGLVTPDDVAEVIRRLGLDPEAVDPCAV